VKEISSINIIEVPSGMEEIAIDTRETYVNYFRNECLLYTILFTFLHFLHSLLCGALDYWVI